MRNTLSKIVLAIMLCLFAGRAEAAFDAATGSFNITTGAPGTCPGESCIAVTGVGFQPKAIIFWWSGRTESTDAAGAATHLRGTGVATSATAFGCVASRGANGGGSAQVDKMSRNDAAICETGNGSMVGWADLASMDADGFTVEILDAFTTDLRVSYLALGGTTLASANVIHFADPPDTGNEAVTGVGFEGDFLYLLGINTATDNATSVDSSMSIGFASGSANEFSWVGGSNDAADPTQTVSYAIASQTAGQVDGAVTTTLANTAEFVSFDADGFTLNWIAAGLTERRYHALVLDTGGNAVVGTVQTDTDADPITASGLSITPTGLLFLSANRAASSAGTATDHDMWSMGAATSASSRTVQATRDADAAATTVVTTAIEHDAVYLSTDGSSVIARMDITAINADGFSAVMDTAEPTAASLVGYVAFGDPPSGSGAAGKFFIIFED